MHFTTITPGLVRRVNKSNGKPEKSEPLGKKNDNWNKNNADLNEGCEFCRGKQRGGMKAPLLDGDAQGGRADKNVMGYPFTQFHKTKQFKPQTSCLKKGSDY